MQPHPFTLAPIAERIWRQKYRLSEHARRGPGRQSLGAEHELTEAAGALPATEAGPILADGSAAFGRCGEATNWRAGRDDFSVEDTFRRVAIAAASVEREVAARAFWTAAFYDAMADFGFLPAGRILAGAGSGRNVTLFNCFVMGPIADDLGAIFDNLREAALTLQQGGGIGHDFSTLRPSGAPVAGVGAEASGPVSFMEVWDAMCRTVMSAGARRGAMMGTLRCDHPDIETFIQAKSVRGRLTNFNLSVLVTDAFMQAVAKDAPWPLVFAGETHRTVSARELWSAITRATYDGAEPGVIFIDRINALNNLAYCEEIATTNPCGEQPLPAYGACLLGSINLARLVRAPFAADAAIDVAALARRVRTAVRLLDNVIDLSSYPLEEQASEARSKRRLGLGITGLADALAMCGYRYASAEGRAVATRWTAAIRDAAYRSSIELAGEKGAFPLFDAAGFLAAPMVERLPDDIRTGIASAGIRNGCLTSIAPTGTISLLAGNVSSGIEPIFSIDYSRRVLEDRQGACELQVTDYAAALFRRLHPSACLPPQFETALEIAPEDHLAMQAALQPITDGAISKTINCPEHLPFAAFENLYHRAYALGLKGCTTFRPNAVTGAILSTTSAAVDKQPASPFASAASARTLQAAPHRDAKALLTCIRCGREIGATQAGCWICPTCGVSECS